MKGCRTTSGKKLLFLLPILLMVLLFSGCGEESSGSASGFFARPPDTLQIALVPFEGIPDEDVEVAKAALEAYYPVQVTVQAPRNLPKSAWYAPRKRYRADSLIRYLDRTCPEGYTRVIGLTTKDISTTKGQYPDYGIMGLAFTPGASCVVSTFRVGKYAKNREHFEERLTKVCRHEVAHTFGLPHCESDSCVVSSANGSAKNIDRQRPVLCADCSRKIYKRWPFGYLKPDFYQAEAS